MQEILLQANHRHPFWMPGSIMPRWHLPLQAWITAVRSAPKFKVTSWCGSWLYHNWQGSQR